MVHRFKELICKEVVNIRDGTRYGYVCDVIVDINTGKIQYIVIPGPSKLFGIFKPHNEYIISWKDITHIGDDIILVDVCSRDCLKECC